jgi:hypothetical protein
MSTTKQEQYDRLRKIFNSAIRGKNTDALLWALANPAVYLVDNVEAIHDNVYIATAVDRYLDQRLADYNLVRPPEVGLSDDIFRDIGISVINKKQIRELVMSILTTMFGEELTQATAKSNEFEPYNLDDGDTLRLSFDGGSILEIIFSSSQFQNISAATAQEVADAITKTLRAQGKTGRAFAKDDGDGAYVTIISDTSGPQSSVVVWGGRAQNVLMFDKIRPTTGSTTTQWTISPQSGGAVRITWTGGSNPSVGKIRVGDYVNIFGSAFDTNNQGTFTIISVKGGTVGNAYFEIENPIAASETQLQGTLDGLLFFQPFKNTLTTKNRYAALFQEESRLLEVFIPATTKVVRRERKGASHIHEPIITTESYDPGSNQITDITVPSPGSIVDGSYFNINSENDNNVYYVYFDTTGSDLIDPAPAGRTGIRIDISSAVTSNDVAILLSNALNNTGDFSVLEPSLNFVRVCNNLIGISTSAANVDVPGLVITVFQSGADASSTLANTPNPTESLPDQEGPYTYDVSQPFVLSDVGTQLTNLFVPNSNRILEVADSSLFPDEQGYIAISYGTDRQEAPVPYLSRPSPTTLLISPAYQIQNEHSSGTEVRLISQAAPVTVSKNGTDYPAYLTDVVAGRTYAEDLIKQVTATGVNLVINILYPGSEGLGKWGEVSDEKVAIWGEDSYV